MQVALNQCTTTSALFPAAPCFGGRLSRRARRRPNTNPDGACKQQLDNRNICTVLEGCPKSRSYRAASTASSDSAVFRHPGELDLNLRQYMVVLEKPVGLTLAPDPRTGQVVVQDVRPDSPAHKCGLIQVGDVVRSCSAVFGDDMWPAVDIRRVRWAINSRLGDVRLVMERAARRPRGAPTAWYCGGKAGVATRERDGMQLPYTFDTSPTPDDPGSFLDLPGAGRSMMVAFHRNTVTQPPPSRRAATAAAAHAEALQRLRRELLEARGMPRLDLSLHPRPGGPDGFVLPPAPPPPSSNLTSRGPAGGGGGGGTGPKPAGASGALRSSPSLNGGGSGAGGVGEAGPPPPPPPVVEVVAPAPPSAASGGVGGSSSSSSGGGEENGMGPGVKGRGSANNAAAAAAAAANGGSGGGGGSGGSTAAAGSSKERRVVTFLPWLLVTCGRLEHRHIAHIASSKSLGALLELSLTRGAQQQPQPQPQSQAQGTQPPGQPQAGAQPAGPAEGAAASGGGGSGGGGARGGGGSGGYMVVRGSDLMPLASDVGRVSFQALQAAAAAAATAGAGGSPAQPPSPPGEVQPPPPPGSAAATAALINGAEVTAAAAAAPALDGSGGLLPPGLISGSAAAGAGNNPATGPALIVTGSSVPTAGGAEGARLASAAAAGGGGGGLGSSTMAFLNRSIFLNLRPNPAAVAAAAFNRPPPSSSPPAAAATFSSQPTSRYDPGRVRHLLNAAASLQRLAFRRGGWLKRLRRDQCAVMLHCDEGLESEVAVLLAGWLHWYGRLPLQEASLAAETAVGVSVDQALLEAGTAALLLGARERCSRVVLTWKYGGLSAYVAGDVVASWGARVPMVRCRSPLGCKGDTHPGHFYLEVQGLRPGVYYYKYIVDGTWAVDSLSPKVLDSAGNWNNVLVVPEPPQVLTSREGLALARWQAARLAFEAKMGLQGGRAP